MSRLTAAVLALSLAGCAAPPSQRVGATDGEESLVAAARPTPLAEVAPTEGELRRALATAVDPTEAALALVRRLDREERLPEALVVLDTALRRRPAATELQVARAGVLRDLGRRGDALQALGDAIDQATPSAIGAGLWFELAELAGLENDLDRARRTLDRLIADPAAEPFLQQRRLEVGGLQQALAEHRRLVPVRLRDLLADLRGSPDPARRLEVFAQLHAIGGEVAERAELLGCEDADPRVRAACVRAAVVDETHLGSLCARALLDPAPAVRIAAAERATALTSGEAVAILLPVLTNENDPDVFAALHAALRGITGSAIELTEGASADPAARAATVAQWRRQWER